MPEEFASTSTLSMESRSILKSIQTEESKLSQSTNLTRSDRHYFRARFNYYRLSLLRLPSDERTVLEPVLGQFLAKITALEMEQDKVSAAPNLAEPPPPPFLAAVTAKPEEVEIEFVAAAPKEARGLPATKVKEISSQLGLLKLALAGELNESARKIVQEGIDRVIKALDESH